MWTMTSRARLFSKKYRYIYPSMKCTYQKVNHDESFMSFMSKI